MLTEEIQRKEAWEGIFAGLGGTLMGQLEAEGKEIRAGGEAAGKLLADGVIASLADSEYLAPIVAAAAEQAAAMIGSRESPPPGGVVDPLDPAYRKW